MDTIGEIIGSIVSFVLQIILLVIESILAIFLPGRRASLKEKWANSTYAKVEIVLGSALLIALTVVGIYIALKLKSCRKSVPIADKQEEVILPEDEIGDERTFKDKLKDSAKEKAVEFLKEKWENR